MLRHSIRSSAGSCLWRAHQQPSCLAKLPKQAARNARTAAGSHIGQRRHYAVAAEQTNKGVVTSLSLPYDLRKEYTDAILERTLMIPSCKAILPITLMRCIFHGSRIRQAFIFPGKSTSKTWKRATCRYLKHFNLHLLLCQHQKVVYRQ